MPRLPTGTVEWRGDRWYARVTLADKSRPWVPLDDVLPPLGAGDRPRAKLEAAALAARMRARGVTTRGAGGGGPGETFRDYTDRWMAWRTARGLASERVDRGRLATHVWPAIGPVPLRALTAAQLEDLVAQLDAKVRGGACAYRTAEAAWSLVKTSLDDACHAKDRALRVLAVDPAARVRGPDAVPRKAKQYLYPAEVRALLADRHAPRGYRRLVACAVYLYVRAGELKALEWSRVDLARARVLVDRSEDAITGEVGTPKNGEERAVPIEPTLLPLLAAMRAEAGGDAATGRVFAGVPARWWRTDKLLTRLRVACAPDRYALLTATTATRKRLTFHDLRATGLTWMAVRGDEPLRIKQRAGHKHFQTTERYIREADVARGPGFGAPFPPLPACLLGESSTESSGGPPHGGRPLRMLGQKQRAEVRAYWAGQAARIPAAPQGAVGAQPPATTQVTEADTMPKGADRAPADPRGTIAETIPTPREALLAALARAITDATAAGDLACAQVANDAVSRLLGTAPASPVVDLASRRGRP